MKPDLRIALVAALLCAFAVPARADQFMYVDLAQARAALSKLQAGDVVHHFCAPCGDAKSERMTIRTLGIDRIWDREGSARPYRSDGRTFWTVELNDQAIDLAYVYVREGRGWRNLADLVGLAPWRVPALLPPARTGTRWRCGTRADNPYWTIFDQRRDPCPIDVEAYEAKAREATGWR